jgi:hypothetical protein
MTDRSFRWTLPVDSWWDVLNIHLLQTEKRLKSERCFVFKALDCWYVPMMLVEVVGCLVAS